MPRRPAGLKSLRRDAKRHLRNQVVKSRLRTEENKLARMLERGDMAAVEGQVNLLTKLFQRAAARKIIEANKAARKQAQLQTRLSALKTRAGK